LGQKRSKSAKALFEHFLAQNAVPLHFLTKSVRQNWGKSRKREAGLDASPHVLLRGTKVLLEAHR